MIETVEGTEIDPEELNVPGQWYVSKKKGKAAPLVDNEARHMERQRAAEKLAGRKMAAKSVERQFARVPDGADKIVMRPHGGLIRMMKYGSAYLADVILRAAGVSPDAAGEDVILMNVKQHSILVATVSAERKREYADLKLIMFEGEKIEMTTYIAMPEDCGKGVVHEVPLSFSDEDILKRLQIYGNPPVLGVRRLGRESRTVLILFEDKEVPRWVRLTPVAQRCVLYRKKYEVCNTCGRLGHREDVCPDPGNVKCRGCGMEKPPQNHLCESKCQLCGRGHPLGDKKCRELYRVPYEVKKKKWERKMNMQQHQQLQKKEQAGAAADGNLRGRSKDRRGNEDFRARNDSFPRLEKTTGGKQQRNRSSSRTRAHSGSRPRGRSSSRVPANAWTKKRSPSRDRKGVSFGSQASQTKNKKDEEIDKLRKEIGELKEVVNKLTRELQKPKLQECMGSPSPP
ncbi:unnamed protein product, partial [Ixodes persulcatus]